MPRDLFQQDQNQPKDLLEGYQEPSQPEQPSGFSFGEMVSNIPSSAVQFGKNIAMPFLHPIDTAESVGKLAMSSIDKGAEMLANSVPENFASNLNKFNNMLVDAGLPLDRLPEDPSQMNFQHTKQAEALGQFFADRYGSLDNLKQTAQNDPVGVLSDLSMVLTGGGTAAATLPGKVGKFGQVVQKAGMATEPLNLMKGAAKYGVGKYISKTKPAELYESSAKFSTTFPKEKRTAMAETALQHGILPTAKGMDKLNEIAGKFDTQITGLIDEATKSGKTIPKAAIYKHLRQLRREMGGTKVGASKNLKQINNAAKEIDIQLKSLNKKTLTAQELQDIKTSAYKRVSFEGKQLRSQQGTEAATKAIARGAKEAIESIADVKDLNKELGKLLELKEPLSRSTGRIENRDIIGIGAPIKIGAAGAAGGAGGAAVGTGLAILENPHVKARLAIKLKQIQDAGKLNMIDHKLLPTLVHYGLLQAGRVAQLPSGNAND